MNDVPQTFKGKALRFIWTYHNSYKAPIGIVARYDGTNGSKDVVPFFKRIDGSSWAPGGAEVPRPLFGLDILRLHKPNEMIFIVEGEKCAAALQYVGLTAITSCGGAQQAPHADWQPLNNMAHVRLLLDNDSVGETYGKTVYQQLRNLKNPPKKIEVVRFTDLSSGGDIVDWMQKNLQTWDGFSPIPDEQVSEVKNKMLLMFDDRAEPVPSEWHDNNSASGEWAVPISINTPYIPSWPDNILPTPINEFVYEVSRSTETPIELASLLALSAIATAAQGKYRVCVEGDYFEPVNLWVCVALPSGNRKTSVLESIRAPLQHYEYQQRLALDKTIKEAESNLKTAQERINKMRKEAVAAKTNEQCHKIQEEVRILESNLPEVPKVRQLWTNDVTPENLGTIISDNESCMSILSDEGGIFDIMAGRYSGGIPNLDVFLQGHAGSPIRVNRGSRPPVFIQQPALTLGLCPQPDVLRALAHQPGFRGRGLLARFLYAKPSSNVGYRTLETHPISELIKQQYHDLIITILKHQLALDPNGEKQPHTLHLSLAAHSAWKDFAKVVEVGMRDGGDFANLTDWAGKLPGAVIRMAALFHIARHALTGPWCCDIEVIDMQNAIRMADKLGYHAIAVFDFMGADSALEGARTILKWIHDKCLSQFTLRDCQYVHKSRFHRVAEVEASMEILLERHFIRKIPPQSQRGRPSRIYEVNPMVLSEDV